MQELFKENFFKAGVPVYMDWLKNNRNGLSYEFMPNKGSPLRVNTIGEEPSVFVRCDSTMGAYVAINQKWEPEKAAFFKELTSKRFKGLDVTLVDIGANVGLFTRSCLNARPCGVKAYCYEADPTNFKYLELNLNYLDRDQISLNNMAVLDRRGSIDFYLDADNTGNHSLNPNSVREDERNKISIQGINAGEECHKWTSNSRPIFFKSDTQGFDEAIISAIPSSFWDNVYGGIFEIRRIKGKNYSEEKLLCMLNKFKNKVADRSPGQQLQTEQIIKFIDGPNDMSDLDICFWN